MFLQKLTKSYSNSLPTYEPIPSSSSPPHEEHHETGSFSCTYSPQHSVGVARITVQSAELRKPRGWRRWFKLKPSAWVKVKVLGRTMMETDGHEGGKGRKGMFKTWREDRVVGRTSVRARTYTPNFEFKSYYALIGPYEKQLELEVRNKRRFWVWPFASDSLAGTATFLLPHTSLSAHPADAATVGAAGASLRPPGSRSEHSLVAYRDHDHSSQDGGGALQDILLQRARTPSRMSMSSSLAPTVHGAEGELVRSETPQNEWAVQAPLFDKEMDAIQGYLLFNVFWYPAVPMEFTPPTYSRRDPEEEEEADEGGGTPPTPGIVTFTLHSIDQLDTPLDREIISTLSLGWRLSPLHTARSLRIGFQPLSRESSTSTTESANGRGMARRLQRPDSRVVEDGEGPARQGATVKFDSTFEFLCLDPSTTNVVLKVFETYQGMTGRKKQELVGHTSVPLRDLIGSAVSGSGPDGALGEKPQGTPRVGRDRMLSLLEHPTGKARVCVEWRALQIPSTEVHPNHHVPVVKHG